MEPEDTDSLLCEQQAEKSEPRHHPTWAEVKEEFMRGLPAETP